MRRNTRPATTVAVLSSKPIGDRSHNSKTGGKSTQLSPASSSLQTRKRRHEWNNKNNHNRGSSGKAASRFQFPLALLAIAIGRAELCRNPASGAIVVDAFGTQRSVASPTRNRRVLFETASGRPCPPVWLFDEGSLGRRSSSGTRISSSLRAKEDGLDDEEDRSSTADATVTDAPLQQFKESTATKRLERAFLPSLAVVGWPLFAAVGIPTLVSYARSFPPNSNEQFAAVTLLIVSNRIYLYALGLTIVATTALRGVSAGDPTELGQRLTILTEELLVLDKPLVVVAEDATPQGADNDVAAELESLSPPTTTTTTTTTAAPPSFVKKLVDDSGLEENLDGVDSGTQALVLPVLVAGLLAFSVVSLPIWSSLSEGFSIASNDELSTAFDAEWIRRIESALSKVLPFISQSWNAILLTLFTRAEFRRLGYELLGIGGSSEHNNNNTNNNTLSTESSVESSVPRFQIVAECLLAVAVTGYGAYYLQYWPAQNFVNSAIAVLVARSIRLDSFTAVASALALLALYDGASVLLIPAAANALTDASVSLGSCGAGIISDVPIVVERTASSVLLSSTSTLAASSNPASSAMGSVAMQKLTSGGFQPGLLVTKLDGDKLTGTLGLGDAVFPSILASFLKRFDEDRNNNGIRLSVDSTTTENNNASTSGSRLFEASLGGYVAGCVACEFAPTIATGGVPALVFIVPFMGLATVLAAVQEGSFDELRQYNNND